MRLYTMHYSISSYYIILTSNLVNSSLSEPFFSPRSQTRVLRSLSCTPFFHRPRRLPTNRMYPLIQQCDCTSSEYTDPLVLNSSSGPKRLVIEESSPHSMNMNFQAQGTVYRTWTFQFPCERFSCDSSRSD